MTLPADLNALLDDLRPAAARAVERERRRRRATIAVAIVLAAGVCAGIAVAAASLLGRPAPKAVQADLRNAANLFVARPGAQPQTARVVAETRDATLYGVNDEHGSFCVELIEARRGLVFGYSCNFSLRTAGDRTMPGEAYTDTWSIVTDDGVTPPVLEFGRLPPGAVAARALLGDGTTEPIQIGLDGFYLYEPSEPKQPIARRESVTIQALDASGKPTWSTYVQPPQPLRTEGTPPRIVSGRVEIAGAKKIRIESGSHPGDLDVRKARRLELRPDGTFSWTPPAGTRLIQLTIVDRNDRPLTSDITPLSEHDWRQLLAEATKPS